MSSSLAALHRQQISSTTSSSPPSRQRDGKTSRSSGERYDMSVSTPILNTGPRPKSSYVWHMPPPGGFLAAEQFNQAYLRDDDVSNLTSLPPDPAGLNVSHTFEPFDLEWKQEDVCDAGETTQNAQIFIQNTIKSILPVSKKDEQWISDSLKNTTTNNTSNSSRPRGRPPKGEVPPCDGEEWRRVGHEHAQGCMAGTTSWGRRLGECIVVSTDGVYREQYYNTTEGFCTQKDGGNGEEETKHQQQQQNQWAEHIKMSRAEDNSVVSGRSSSPSGSSPSSARWIEPRASVAPVSKGKNEEKPKGEMAGCRLPEVIDAVHTSLKTKMKFCHNDMEVEVVKGSEDSAFVGDDEETESLREKGRKLFQCGNSNVVVPQARLTRALGELAARDDAIRKLQCELEETKKKLIKKEKNSPEAKTRSGALSDDKSSEKSCDETVSNVMLLRTEIVTLRSQLADAKAELLESPKSAQSVATYGSQQQREIQRLQRLLDQAEEKVKIVQVEKDMQAHTSEVLRKNIENDFMAKLQKAAEHVANMSQKQKEDERRVLDAKKALQLELEQAKSEVSKMRNELFNNRLKLAQAESRAENFELLANARQAGIMAHQKKLTPEEDLDGTNDVGDDKEKDFNTERERELVEQLAEAKAEIERLKSLQNGFSQETRQEEDDSVPCKTILQAELDKANADIEKLRWELAQQKVLVAEAKADKEGAESVIKDSREDVANLTDELEKHRTELFQAQQDRDLARQKHSEAEQLCEELHERLCGAGEKEAHFSQTISNLKREHEAALAALRNRLSGTERKTNDLRQNLDESEKKSMELQDTICILGKEHDLAISECQDRITYAERTAADLEDSLNKTERRNKEVERRIRELKEERDTAISKLQGKVASTEQEAEDLKVKLREAEAKKSEFQETLRSRERQERSMSSELQTKVSKAERTAIDLHERLNMMEQEKQDFERTTRVLENERHSALSLLEGLRLKFRLQNEVSQRAVDYYIRRQALLQQDVVDAIKELKRTTEVSREKDHNALLLELYAVMTLRGLRKNYLTADRSEENAGRKGYQYHDLYEELGCVEESVHGYRERTKDLINELESVGQKVEYEVIAGKTGHNGVKSIACQTDLTDSTLEFSKAEELKMVRRRREVEFILKLHKHSNERVELAYELAQSRQYNRTLQERNSSLEEKLKLSEEDLDNLRKELSKREDEALECSNEFQCITDREEALANGVARAESRIRRLEKGGSCTGLGRESKAEEPRMDPVMLRQELEEILVLLAETKKRWQDDSKGFMEEINERKEREATLLNETEELKQQLDQIVSLEENSPSKVDRTGSSVARLLAKASLVTRRKDSRTEQRKINAFSPSRVGPDDEPPIASLAFPTPLRSNRKPPRPKREPSESKSEIEPPNFDSNASVSTITFAHAQSDLTALLHRATGLDVVRGGQSPSPGKSSVNNSSSPEEHVEIQRALSGMSSIASGSSILSPPVLSVHLKPDLPEPVPIYASSGKLASSSNSNGSREGSATPSAMELVTQLKSLFDRGNSPPDSATSSSS